MIVGKQFGFEWRRIRPRDRITVWDILELHQDGFELVAGGEFGLLWVKELPRLQGYEWT